MKEILFSMSVFLIVVIFSGCTGYDYTGIGNDYDTINDYSPVSSRPFRN